MHRCTVLCNGDTADKDGVRCREWGQLKVQSRSTSSFTRPPVRPRLTLLRARTSHIQPLTPGRPRAAKQANTTLLKFNVIPPHE